MTTPNIAQTATTMIDLLVSRIDQMGTPACVGIDPVYSKLPEQLRSADEADAIASFSLSVLDAVAGQVPAVKPQSACFERYGSEGYAALERVIAKARDLGLVVILDAKRGDIGSSAQHYAKGAADMGAHFITVSPYMGPSTIEPFLDAGLGVFALARTSNPDSDEVQLQQLADGRHVVHAISSMIAKMGSTQTGSSGLSALGAVVGATKAGDEMGKLRELMPDQMFLVPGVGAQGGTVEDVRPMCRLDASSAGQLGVIVNASRSVLYPQANTERWQDGVHQAAIGFAESLRTLN
ncbi:MAG: orotidine-5'-phosphate decarboxylase [Phycisphaerae bacterium]|nr:orotidine-5'-phosphate decarboxylase [Phycisphaerae bacterium]MBM91234.1 orotidine-5'-phosphate decarboxylase [Phycisphaerae bacterium]HCT45776.1 orotidine-5'-phosphate decarboxylase [Phycisphaerales bacterium]|tara:strand:- start:248 stop:1129 length:882 start_codon:yes stop_codon:yes gene_type:complete